MDQGKRWSITLQATKYDYIDIDPPNALISIPNTDELIFGALWGRNFNSIQHEYRSLLNSVPMKKKRKKKKKLSKRRKLSTVSESDEIDEVDYFDTVDSVTVENDDPSHQTKYNAKGNIESNAVEINEDPSHTENNDNENQYVLVSQDESINSSRESFAIIDDDVASCLFHIITTVTTLDDQKNVTTLDGQKDVTTLDDQKDVTTLDDQERESAHFEQILFLDQQVNEYLDDQKDVTTLDDREFLLLDHQVNKCLNDDIDNSSTCEDIVYTLIDEDNTEDDDDDDDDDDDEQEEGEEEEEEEEEEGSNSNNNDNIGGALETVEEVNIATVEAIEVDQESPLETIKTKEEILVEESKVIQMPDSLEDGKSEFETVDTNGNNTDDDNGGNDVSCPTLETVQEVILPTVSVDQTSPFEMINTMEDILIDSHGNNNGNTKDDDDHKEEENNDDNEEGDYLNKNFPPPPQVEKNSYSNSDNNDDDNDDNVSYSTLETVQEVISSTVVVDQESPFEIVNTNDNNDDVNDGNDVSYSTLETVQEIILPTMSVDQKSPIEMINTMEEILIDSHGNSNGNTKGDDDHKEEENNDDNNEEDYLNKNFPPPPQVEKNYYSNSDNNDDNNDDNVSYSTLETVPEIILPTVVVDQESRFEIINTNEEICIKNNEVVEKIEDLITAETPLEMIDTKKEILVKKNKVPDRLTDENSTLETVNTKEQFNEKVETLIEAEFVHQVEDFVLELTPQQQRETAIELACELIPVDNEEVKTSFIVMQQENSNFIEEEISDYSFVNMEEVFLESEVVKTSSFNIQPDELIDSSTGDGETVLPKELSQYNPPPLETSVPSTYFYDRLIGSIKEGSNNFDRNSYIRTPSDTDSEYDFKTEDRDVTEFFEITPDIIEIKENEADDEFDKQERSNEEKMKNQFSTDRFNGDSTSGDVETTLKRRHMLTRQSSELAETTTATTTTTIAMATPKMEGVLDNSILEGITECITKEDSVPDDTTVEEEIEEDVVNFVEIQLEQEIPNTILDCNKNDATNEGEKSMEEEGRVVEDEGRVGEDEKVLQTLLQNNDTKLNDDINLLSCDVENNFDAVTVVAIEPNESTQEKPNHADCLQPETAQTNKDNNSDYSMTSPTVTSYYYHNSYLNNDVENTDLIPDVYEENNTKAVTVLYSSCSNQDKINEADSEKQLLLNSQDTTATKHEIDTNAGKTNEQDCLSLQESISLQDEISNIDIKEKNNAMISLIAGENTNVLFYDDTHAVPMFTENISKVDIEMGNSDASIPAIDTDAVTHCMQNENIADKIEILENEADDEFNKQERSNEEKMKNQLSTDRFSVDSTSGDVESTLKRGGVLTGSTDQSSELAGTTTTTTTTTATTTPTIIRDDLNFRSVTTHPPLKWSLDIICDSTMTEKLNYEYSMFKLTLLKLRLKRLSPPHLFVSENKEDGSETFGLQSQDINADLFDKLKQKDETDEKEEKKERISKVPQSNDFEMYDVIDITEYEITEFDRSSPDEFNIKTDQSNINITLLNDQEAINTKDEKNNENEEFINNTVETDHLSINSTLLNDEVIRTTQDENNNNETKMVDTVDDVNKEIVRFQFLDYNGNILEEGFGRVKKTITRSKGNARKLRRTLSGRIIERDLGIY